MKISTRSRYGTRLMLELALNYGKGPLFLKDIAREEEISEKYLSQIIITLKGCGLVDSLRGAKGGYVLARSPFQITLKDIVGVLEGGLNLLDCINNTSGCRRIQKCVTRDVWKSLGDKIAETLDRTTLEDLAKKHQTKVKKVIMYNI